jgi:hypothetical protein
MFGDPNYRFHHVWKTAATTPPLLRRVVNLGGHDQGPWILVEQLDDRILDLLLGYQVAVTDEHCGLWAVAWQCAFARRLAEI